MDVMLFVPAILVVVAVLVVDGITAPELGPLGVLVFAVDVIFLI